MRVITQRAAICCPRIPVNRPPDSTLMPAKMNVAGRRSVKYFRWSERSSPALVARFTLWISSILPTAGARISALNCDDS